MAPMMHHAQKTLDSFGHTCLPTHLSSGGADFAYRQRTCDLRWGCRQQNHTDHQLLERRCRAAHIMCSASQTDAATKASLPPLKPLTEESDYGAAHSFATFANWIIPGKVLLGRYPYVEPSRCRLHDQGEEQLLKILQQGVTTFISLQAETPPQSGMTIGGVNGFVPYAAVASLLVSAMSGPPGMKEVNGLRNQYLDTFLPPRRKQQRHLEQQEERRPRRKLEFLHYPITDLDIPTTHQVRELMGEIARRVEAGEVLYVHCWGGRGRAGTVGACLLASLYGLDAEQALARVQRAYDTRGELGARAFPLPPSPSQ